MKHEKPPAVVASVSHEVRPAIGASIRAISFRPLGYARSLLIGFVLGCLAFLAGRVGVGSPGVAAELRILMACAGGGAALALAANFLVEKRVRAELDRQRVIFGRYMFGPARELPSPKTR